MSALKKADGGWKRRDDTSAGGEMMVHADVMSCLTLHYFNIYLGVYKCLMDNKSIFMRQLMNLPEHDQHLNAWVRGIKSASVWCSEDSNRLQPRHGANYPDIRPVFTQIWVQVPHSVFWVFSGVSTLLDKNLWSGWIQIRNQSSSTGVQALLHLPPDVCADQSRCTAKETHPACIAVS